MAQKVRGAHVAKKGGIDGKDVDVQSAMHEQRCQVGTGTGAMVVLRHA
jgi:hypothetical protein